MSDKKFNIQGTESFKQVETMYGFIYNRQKATQKTYISHDEAAMMTFLNARLLMLVCEMLDKHGRVNA